MATGVSELLCQEYRCEFEIALPGRHLPSHRFRSNKFAWLRARHLNRLITGNAACTELRAKMHKKAILSAFLSVFASSHKPNPQHAMSCAIVNDLCGARQSPRACKLLKKRFALRVTAAFCSVAYD